MVTGDRVHIKLYATPERGGPHTLSDLLDALEERLRGAPRAMSAILESQVIHQEAALLQEIDFERTMLAPSEWLENCRLRCAMQTGNGMRSAVTDVVCHLSKHLAANHVGTASFSLAPKAGSVDISAWLVASPVNCRLGLVARVWHAACCLGLQGPAALAERPLCLPPMLLPLSVMSFVSLQIVVTHFALQGKDFSASRTTPLHCSRFSTTRLMVSKYHDQSGEGVSDNVLRPAFQAGIQDTRSTILLYTRDDWTLSRRSLLKSKLSHAQGLKDRISFPWTSQPSKEKARKQGPKGRSGELKSGEEVLLQ